MGTYVWRQIKGLSRVFSPTERKSRRTKTRQKEGEKAGKIKHLSIYPWGRIPDLDLGLSHVGSQALVADCPPLLNSGGRWWLWTSRTCVGCLWFYQVPGPCSSAYHQVPQIKSLSSSPHHQVPVIRSLWSSPYDQVPVIKCLWSGLHSSSMWAVFTCIKSLSSSPYHQVPMIKSLRSSPYHQVLIIKSLWSSPCDQVPVIKSLWSSAYDQDSLAQVCGLSLVVSSPYHQDSLAQRNVATRHGYESPPPCPLHPVWTEGGGSYTHIYICIYIYISIQVNTCVLSLSMWYGDLQGQP